MASSRQVLGWFLRNDDVRSISRRYFVANGRDGTLTRIGVIVGAGLVVAVINLFLPG